MHSIVFLSHYACYFGLYYISVVKVENLVNQWQQMGVEAPLDANLEDALSEVI